MRKLLFLCLFFNVYFLSFSQVKNLKSGVIGGVSYDWFRDELDNNYLYSIPDGAVSFHVGYQLQADLKNNFSFDAALLYGQKRGKFASRYALDQSVDNFSNKFSRNYLALNGVVNYNLVGQLKLGIGVEPSIYFKETCLMNNTVKSRFDIPVVAKVSYSLRYVDLSLSYKHGFNNIMDGAPGLGKARARDLQLSIFIPIFK